MGWALRIWLGLFPVPVLLWVDGAGPWRVAGFVAWAALPLAWVALRRPRHPVDRRTRSDG